MPLRILPLHSRVPSRAIPHPQPVAPPDPLWPIFMLSIPIAGSPTPVLPPLSLPLRQPLYISSWLFLDAEFRQRVYAPCTFSAKPDFCFVQRMSFMPADIQLSKCPSTNNPLSFVACYISPDAPKHLVLKSLHSYTTALRYNMACGRRTIFQARAATTLDNGQLWKQAIWLPVATRTKLRSPSTTPYACQKDRAKNPILSPRVEHLFSEVVYIPACWLAKLAKREKNILPYTEKAKCDTRFLIETLTKHEGIHNLLGQLRKEASSLSASVLVTCPYPLALPASIPSSFCPVYFSPDPTFS